MRTPNEWGENWRAFRNACPCEFCRGQLAPPCPEGWEERSTGGREPWVVQFDPTKVESHWLPARNADDGPEIWPESLIIAFPASSHGCWKVRKHQTLVLVIPL